MPGSGERLLRWMGLGARARAADVALATLFHGIPPGTRHVADALDDAYCVLLPHEAACRAALHQAFWALAREENRKRQFIARCLEQPDQEARANHNGAG